MFAIIQRGCKKTVIRVVAGFMALYLFDISVDFQHTPTVEQDLSINEIESLSELVLEEIVDFENLFEEVPESDREPITKTALFLTYIIPLQVTLQSTPDAVPVINQTRYAFVQYTVPYSRTTPPPRQA